MKSQEDTPVWATQKPTPVSKINVGQEVLLFPSCSRCQNYSLHTVLQ